MKRNCDDELFMCRERNRIVELVLGIGLFTSAQALAILPFFS